MNDDRRPTFRDGLRRDLAELDAAGRAFWKVLVRELRLEQIVQWLRRMRWLLGMLF
jgi:hypothetical protein